VIIDNMTFKNDFTDNETNNLITINDVRHVDISNVHISNCHYNSESILYFYLTNVTISNLTIEDIIESQSGEIIYGKNINITGRFRIQRTRRQNQLITVNPRVRYSMVKM